MDPSEHLDKLQEVCAGRLGETLVTTRRVGNKCVANQICSNAPTQIRPTVHVQIIRPCLAARVVRIRTSLPTCIATLPRRLTNINLHTGKIGLAIICTSRTHYKSVTCDHVTITQCERTIERKCMQSHMLRSHYEDAGGSNHHSERAVLVGGSNICDAFVGRFVGCAVGWLASWTFGLSNQCVQACRQAAWPHMSHMHRFNAGAHASTQYALAEIARAQAFHTILRPATPG